MGLTNKSTGMHLVKEHAGSKKENKGKYVIALAGNPNVGKSTVFNALTGLNQHTGNWPGKTVSNAEGICTHKNIKFKIVDLPGTYSLMSSSPEEEIARDFICFGKPDAAVVVVDATCLERNLNLVLQTMEITEKVVVCLNLMDEASRKGIEVDVKKLSRELGVPVVATSATKEDGLDQLMAEIHDVCEGKAHLNPRIIQYDEAIENAASALQPALTKHVGNQLKNRWVALKLIDGDEKIAGSIHAHLQLTDEDKKFITDETCKVMESLPFDSDTIRDMLVSRIVGSAKAICNNTVASTKNEYDGASRKLDRILVSKKFGIPLMLLVLSGVLWITISGANYPSQVIAKFLFFLQGKLSDLMFSLHSPVWLEGLVVKGMYRTLAWVVSVMLPPMAIFFPLFTLLEDMGYLPRVAFNLDSRFKKACACGKQALTMCMGLGCNAAGVVGCRIIDSPRERLIAILTNNFIPCNGRFPTLIAISTMFVGGVVSGWKGSLISSLAVTFVILLGVFITLVISRLLSKTVLKGVPSTFTLELPPFRKPQVGKILVHSIFDRTLFVLGRAVTVAAPAGIVIWLFANINVGNASILTHCATFLQPFAHAIGLDGYILMAFILGLPANEIVVPIIIMSYMKTGTILELENLNELHRLFVSNGWTWLTAVNMMLLCLMHYPCGTTLLTIRKETQSWKWTLLAFLVPTVTGITACFALTQAVRLLSLI